ncbi:MAG: enoyl-CoA hydratase/isomerase family protein [Pseudomonadota bacterium]
MEDILIRQDGRVGRVTLNRPKALNALTYDMVLQLEAALVKWADDPSVSMILMDAEGERAFCSGGDIAEMYATATAGDFDYGRRFWSDEYRLNARIAAYPKPIVTFLQGFTMGGGVGVGCHGSHRIVGEDAQIAMPECGIGLVPDVGGTHLLAGGPGRLGEFLGTTGWRMGPADAIRATFADHFVPQTNWPDLKAELLQHGDVSAVREASTDPGSSKLAAQSDLIDTAFASGTMAMIAEDLASDGSDFAKDTLKRLSRPSPLAMDCALILIRAARNQPGVAQALAREYRFTYRSAEHGEFIEGIRAAIIDKDRTPAWLHNLPADVPPDKPDAMTAHLGAKEWSWEG